MSYRNPQQFIDTSTARHFERLQQSIAGTFANFADSYKKAQKEEAEKIKKEQARIKNIQDKNEKAEQSIREKGAEVLALNPSIDFADTFYSKIDKYSELADSLDLNLITDPQERALAQQDMAQIYALPAMFRNGLEDLGATALIYEEASKNTNRMGGLYGGADSRLVSDINVFINRQKGTRKAIIKKTNGVYQPGYMLGSDGEELQFYSVQRLNEMLESKDGGLVIIPDETKDFKDMQAGARGYSDEDEEKQFDKNLLGEPQVRLVDNNRYEEVYRVVDQEAAVAKVEAQIKANADSMTAWEKVAFYNTQIDSKNPLVAPISEGYNAEINDALFLEGYREYFKQKYIPKEIVDNKTKLTDAEYKRRMGIVDKDKDKDIKEVIDISYIKDLKIPVQAGPPLESGQRPVDLTALEEQLNKEGFRVTKSEEVGPRGVNKITITKSIAGADNQAVISEEMTPQDIKRNLELVETGKMPAKVEDEDFSLYKINQ
jgi:hypothetical protein